ncbi:glycerophosphodiester phosphodiesterase [Allosalinactinospora lopnorensis]|uniref:glycerophosphodiester phosphodiesterase n=1 Tax=Allosalinactinospora lopnorensis TaxID=1352348 RepID=UPI000623BE1E|nr:glycerophosphodiester phosphodiesterase family protein [Allosalinactinospora lopnorensis]
MIVVAHRGASGYAPENTLAALRPARAYGAHMVEIDVRTTADGEFVAMHDPTPRRTTDVARVFPDRRSWRVSEFTLAKIRRLDAGSWFGRRFAGEPVPTLEGALDTVRASGMGVLVELKVERRDPGMCRRLIACLRADTYWREAIGEGRFILQSFDPFALRAVAASVPGLRVAVLGRAYRRLGLRRIARYAHLINPHHLQVTAPYVRHAHARGLAMFGWTANNEHAIRRLVRDGVDGIITDYPDRIPGDHAFAA